MRCLVLAWLLLPLSLRAASAELWMNGTRPYETVSYREMDLEAFGDGRSSFAHAGLNLEYGILDHWMISGLVAFPTGGMGSPSYLFSSRLRFSEAGAWPLDAAVYAERPIHSGTDQLRAGLILGKDLGDHELAVNGSYNSVDGPYGSVGYRSPYILYATRLGLAWEFGDRTNTWSPEVDLMLPGDVALRLGGSWQRQGAFEGWRVILSYELFPTPSDEP